MRIINILFFPIIIQIMIKKKEQEFNEVLKVCCLASETTRISNELNSSIMANQQNTSKMAPLHSHQRVNQSIFSNSFRLLYSTSQQLNIQTKSLNNGENNSILAFGSSEKRKIRQFQGCQNYLQQTKTSSNIGKINGKAYLKQSEYNNLLKDHYGNNLGEEYKVSEKHQKNRKGVGFGVSKDLKRTFHFSISKGNPGPGSYNVSKCLLSKGIKIDPESKRNMRSSDKTGQNYNFASQIQSAFEAKVNKIMSKQKWKKKALERKMKYNHLLCILNGNRNTYVGTFEQNNEQRLPQSDQVESPKRKCKNEHINEQVGGRNEKLYRNYLRDKTCGLLGKVQEYGGDKSWQQRKPLCKMMGSNSFRPKNDHAYEAHFYRPSQKESQYIFLRGGVNEKIDSNQSSYFKSTVKRIIF